MREISIHQKENHLDESTPKWFAIYTKYKREKLVAKALEQKNIQNYLPLQRIAKQWGRKKRISELPLFSCYVFVKITKSEYIKVLQTEYVLQFIQFSRNLISIPEKEINIIKRIVGEGIEIETHEIEYVEGDYLEIVKGNLMGMKGKLIEKLGSNWFVVDLEHLGYSLRLQMDSSYLKKVSNNTSWVY